MAFQTVSDLSTETAVALGGFNKKTRQENPTTITGYFIGSKEVDSPKSKTGKAKLHVFQTAEGNIGVWGKTDLDQKLRGATVGALTRVTFTGMQETKNNPMYKYRVEVDKSDVIEITDGGTTGSAYADDGVETGASYSEEEGDDELDAAPPARATAPRTAARQPSAESQSKVQELLSRRK